MWRASGKRTRSRAAGASVGRVLPRRTTRGRRRLIFFGAVCPAEGKGAGLVVPSCNSEAMALHLKEISIAVAQAHMPSFSSMRRDGISRRSCSGMEAKSSLPNRPEALDLEVIGLGTGNRPVGASSALFDFLHSR
jgi:hypothetical protein